MAVYITSNKKGSPIMKCFRQALSYVILALVLSATTRGQVIDQKLFRTVPDEQRESLINRLNLYLEYDRKGQFDKRRELYDNAELCSLCKGDVFTVDCEDKSQKGQPECLKCQQDLCTDDPECVKNCRTIRVRRLVSSPLQTERLGYKIRSVSLIKGKAMKYKITLYVKSRLTIAGETQIVEEKATLRATLQNGEWNFSGITFD
jgi:hypothetical protein